MDAVKQVGPVLAEVKPLRQAFIINFRRVAEPLPASIAFKGAHTCVGIELFDVLPLVKFRLTNLRQDDFVAFYR